MKSERMKSHRPSLAIHAVVLALAAAGMAACSDANAPAASAPQLGDDLVTTTQANPAAAPTADAAVRKTPVVPGRPARVFIFAGFGDHCEPVAAPHITITAPPAKGDVSFKPGQETTIKTSKQGTCIGQKAKGTGVYYTARAGQSGTDRFTLTAKLTSGETATRTFEVRIAE